MRDAVPTKAGGHPATEGDEIMRTSFLAALGAAALSIATPTVAQDLPLHPGDYWDVTAISVNDGHMGDYTDYLAGQWRQQEEFSKTKGWTKGYHILSNVNRRADEPDLYLVRIFDHVPNSVEDMAREKEMNAHLQASARQMLAGSGARASFRKIGSNELLQEMNWTH